MTQVESQFGTTTMALKLVFSRLAPEDIARLRQVATIHKHPANTVLCREGEVEHIFYVLHAGIVKITQQVPDGEERLLALRGPGEFFGEMALIDDSPRSATVTAATDVAVIEITEGVFDQVLSNSPTLAITLLRQAHSILRSTMQQQIGELQAKNVELSKAYADLQAAQAELVQSARLKRDLEVAAQVQRSILPAELPQVNGLSFAAHARPAREVGGDFYDVFRLDDQHLGVLIADVSDKSIHAAFFMAISRALFLTEARRTLSPREVVVAVNDLLLDVSSEDNMFVTAFYSVLHLDDRKLTYVRAGHDKPLLRHADGALEILDGAGRFLGMLPDLSVEELTVELRSGDRLVMYSDGVPDANNAAGERYGLDRLRACLRPPHTDRAVDLAAAILNDVLIFQGDAPQFDDITLLVAAID
ncbi:MAG: SpoIIE family protein phosphatase [Chloroflexi bacterium]|nr:SpoIIE family protein phosphatase [Chloroflexota bacterium]